ncbi:PREDICTED: uncharacterized protein LOC106741742 [Dinoponera quadriceps]|uniref:Uncharacterized protein LOC106741742 n=1 Tax=Dinoponera quadriceps TaxID=609295 RepID=A0A6P3WTN8_DINQU|nr:PREDICTED: uncharacterized protein LOC106741742 [Dinoponera quadriceps]
MKMYKFRPNPWIVILYISILSYISQAQAEGISCFKCLKSSTRLEDKDRLCSHFDGSAKFQVFCPTSTFCMKRTIELRSKTSVATTVLRDCAPQKYTSHVYNEDKRKWDKIEEIIKTAYDEGCFIGEHRGSPTNPPEYCFCSFHLCNSSPMQIGVLGKIYGIMLVLLIVGLL